MDFLKREEINCKCKKHQAHEIKFINADMKEGNGNKCLYYCDICIGEDISLQHNSILPIKYIIEYGEKNIIQKWPPVNNYQILKELSEITSQNQNRDAVRTRITNLFSELKEQMVQQLDLIQKKMINTLQDNFKELDTIIESYQQISKIDQFRNLLIKNQSNNLSKTTELQDLITKLTSEKTQNTLLLEKLLENHKSCGNLLNGKYETQFKDSLLSYMKTLNSTFQKENIEQGDKNGQPLYNLERKEGQQIKSIKESLSSLQMMFGFEQVKHFCVIQNMIQSTYENSKNIDVIRNNSIISLIPRNSNTTGQLYSEQKIDYNQIYEFKISFKQKPTNYICLGFEEEQFKNRPLGGTQQNSFILGQQNLKFCSKLVKGNKNLQALCQKEFVETLVIQVLLSENKLYIADYPQIRAVNCMDEAKYQFKKEQDYFFTIFFWNQQTSVDIISSKVIEAFTII